MDNANEAAAASRLLPAIALRQMATGFFVSRAVQVAAELDIANLLRDGPRLPADLAAASRTDAGALRRLLRALASLGVFAEDTDGRFRLTPMAEYLLSDTPAGSLRDYAIMFGKPENWRAWGELEYSVRTGRPAFERLFGKPLFDYFSEHPGAARVFDAAMAGRSAEEAAALVASYDFSDAIAIVDVGGGRGTLLASVLQANPATLGVLFDLPHTVTGAQEALIAAGVAGRCRVEAGDFFEAVPADGDVYLLHRIIHDWDDERARTILANCRSVMPPHGRLLLLEAVVPPGNAPHYVKLLDLQMLIWTGGLERTEEEYRALLASAGLRLARILPTTTPSIDVIEAVPA